MPGVEDSKVRSAVSLQLVVRVVCKDSLVWPSFDDGKLHAAACAVEVAPTTFHPVPVVEFGSTITFLVMPLFLPVPDRFRAASCSSFIASVASSMNSRPVSLPVAESLVNLSPKKTYTRRACYVRKRLPSLSHNGFKVL